MVPNPAWFLKMFDVPSDFKKKFVKIPVNEFETKVRKCRLYANGPWASTVSLVGTNMTVKWEVESSTFTVSGEYMQ